MATENKVDQPIHHAKHEMSIALSVIYKQETFEHEFQLGRQII